MSEGNGNPATLPLWSQKVELVMGPGTLDELYRCLNALWSDHPEIPEEVRNCINVSAFEVCSNIIEHATGNPLRLRAELRLTASDVEVIFIDDGAPAGVDLSAVSFPEPLADRGRGLAIAKAVLDELVYERHSGCNRWRLRLRV